MKTLLISTAFVALLGISTKMLITEKKATLGDFSTLTYNVNDDKKLEGAYTVESMDKKVWLRGSYKSDARSGNWYAFNSDGKVFLRYNYDVKKLLMIDSASLSKFDVEILDKNADAVSKASIPFPICSIDQYLSLFNSQVSAIIGKEVNMGEPQVPIEIAATINSKGRVDYMLTYTVGKMNYTSSIKVLEPKFDLEWIPAMYEGKIIPSKFTVKSTFSKNAKGAQRFTWNY
jgi:hypothetical protein